MRIFASAVLAALLTSPVLAQDEALSIQAVKAAAQPATVLPAGTQIPLKMTQTVTTKGKGWEEGDQFGLSVASNVMLGDYVIIPQGTPAKGRITWLTSRGAFGKSGKMDVELEHIELSGRRINVDGSYRQEGNGATLATVGGVIVVGVFAGFITGRSGEIPQGRELMATLESDLPVALPAGASLEIQPVQATAAVRTTEQSAAPAEPVSRQLKAGSDGTVRVGGS